MKGINLGLESLTNCAERPSLEGIIGYYEAMERFSNAIHQFDQIVSAYESVCGIRDCIKKYGVTQSLEALYGENFRSAASMEEETEAAKKTLGQKIKHAIEEIKQFFKNLWTRFWNTIVSGWNKLKSSKFVAWFTFKKKNGETVEVRSQGDLNKIISDLDAKLKDLEKQKADLDTQIAEAVKKTSGAYEEKMVVGPLREKLETVKQQISEFTEEKNALEQQKTKADAAAKTTANNSDNNAKQETPADNNAQKNYFSRW